jgi:hypothetical protein
MLVINGVNGLARHSTQRHFADAPDKVMPDSNALLRE